MPPDEPSARLSWVGAGSQLWEQLQATLGTGYTLEKELSGGGMSRVFVAADIALGRKVVIKVLRPVLAEDISLDRFKREIAVTVRLQHPHIVPIFTAGEVDGLPFFTMPFVEGQSIRARLESEGPLPVADAVRLLRDVARALEYAHARGVVHRDIKPDNVLVSGNSAVVTDFGIAKAVDTARTSTGNMTLTQAGMSIGTPAYMAPEQASAAEVDHRADIYAFGAMAYELLTGRLPFVASTVQGMLVAQLTTEPVAVASLRPELPAVLATMIMRCLARDPAARPQTAAALLEMMDSLALTGGEFPASLLATQPAEPATPSIAVLPFANLSTDPENEYLAEGITVEILNALAHVRQLRVAARTSSFAFRGQHVDLAEVGRKLRVNSVLEGSVRRAGPRIRIAAQLISLADGFSLWSERYDRDVQDVFGIEDEIAGAIVEALKLKLLQPEAPAAAPAVRRPPRDLEAYELYLKGRFFFDQRVDGMAKAMENYRRALERDPDFALAHAGVAEGHFMLTLYAAVTPREGAPAAKAAAERALALDPQVAEAYIVLANTSLWYDWDRPATKRLLDQSLELKPSDSLAISCYGFYYASLGRFEEAITRARYALEIDPLGPWARSNMAITCYLARRFEEAVERCRAIIELSPNYSEAYRWMALSQFHLGHWAEGFAAMERAVQMSNRQHWAVSNLGAMLARAKKVDAARAILAELEERATREYVPPLAMVMLHFSLGDSDAAFVWLDRSIEARDFWLIMLNVDPGFDGMRKDPRFAAAIARMGVV